MIGIFLALLAALTYSLSLVDIRKRIDRSDFFSVALVVTFAGNVILWPLALLFTNFGKINFEGVLFFAVAGILSPGIVRLIYYHGLEVVGASVTSSIFATSSMYTSLFSVLLLNEVLAPENWIGIICIVVGVIFVERSLSKPATGPTRISLGRMRKGLVFSLLGALTVTFGFVLRKHGLNIYNEPLLGVALGYSLSLLFYLLLSISFHTTRGPRISGRDFRLFWRAGVFLCLGWVLNFYALSYEMVSIVTPLIHTQPLFVLFFAYLYLKEVEHISLKLVINIVLIVVGVMLISSS